MTDAFQANRDARDDDSESINTISDADDEELTPSERLSLLQGEVSRVLRHTDGQVTTSFRDGEGRIIVHYDEEAFEEIHNTRYGDDGGE